ncbi:MAG: class I SAM-dependent methyltransferase [Planctomycetota bacterium]|nr:class I SAM-dependent methyltransferase [Planctomycetota bacterium]MDA0932188.1 class I SAM-dependent methyltransferase [Planctomycetota bacterium]
MESIPHPQIDVVAPDGRPQLRELAGELGLDVVASASDSSAGLLLLEHAGRLSLVKAGGGSPVAVEFGGARRTGRTGGSARPMLCRAVGLDRGVRRVVDATAGLGRDAFTLAAWGADVVLVERSPILHALLADGLRRAEGSPAAARMTLVRGDARQFLVEAEPPDAVFLDPMFEDRGKAALPGWELQVLRALLGPGEDAVGDLIETARRVATRRVVVKRPAHGRIAGHKPDASYVGGRVRYEVFTPRSDCGPRNPTDT